jgi:hypothetical protein
MTLELPNIVLKLNTEKKLLNTNTNTNANDVSNTINNNIILSEPTVGVDLAKSAALSIPSAKITKSSSYQSLQAVKSPTAADNILRFKDQFAAYLIDYFRSDMVLLNNLLEVSDKIVFKMEDLKHLISILLEIEANMVAIDYEDVLKNIGCCGKICKKLPLFKKINDIIINNRQSFLVSYNTIAVQLQTEFNISLTYIIL